MLLFGCSTAFWFVIPQRLWGQHLKRGNASGQLVVIRGIAFKIARGIGTGGERYDPDPDFEGPRQSYAAPRMTHQQAFGPIEHCWAGAEASDGVVPAKTGGQSSPGQKRAPNAAKPLILERAKGRK